MVGVCLGVLVLVLVILGLKLPPAHKVGKLDYSLDA